jgi:ribulose-5-phosphate 4-epimerase/fuculose-1-phosphate aldolase
MEAAMSDESTAPVAWPRAVPGIGRELTVPQQLACLLRILAPSWQENLSGHITWIADDPDHPGAMWVNPWGMWWEEVTASDIVLVSPDGEFLVGKWDVTPAVYLHTELHRARPDARIVVHNHPYAATLLANLGELPEIAHQNSAIFWDELALVDEYDGSIETAAGGEALARAIGPASGIILRNHGAVVTGTTPGEAGYKAVTFERMCRFHVDALLVGRKPRPIDAATAGPLRDLLRRNTPDAFWHGAVRQLLRTQPEVLE